MTEAPADNYLTHSRGVRSWLCTLDHKRIGVMYLVSILIMFLLGGVFALVVRTALLPFARPIMCPDAYNQMFTLHGTIMIFLFLIPGIPAALGNFVLPIMLGAKDVAFPRLNLASFYLWWAAPCSSSSSWRPAGWTPAGPSTRPTARRPARV